MTKKDFVKSVFILAAFALNSCSAILLKVSSNDVVNSNNQSNLTPSQTKNERPPPLENTSGLVSLEVKDIFDKKAIAELSNKSNKVIYSYYVPSEVSNGVSSVFYYGFRCREKGKKEIDYKDEVTSHLIPSLEPLQTNQSFRFEVSPLPKINATCVISMLYYDDEKAADLLNSGKIKMDKSDNELLDKAMKSAKVEFKINKK